MVQYCFADFSGERQGGIPCLFLLPYMSNRAEQGNTVQCRYKKYGSKAGFKREEESPSKKSFFQQIYLNLIYLKIKYLQKIPSDRKPFYIIFFIRNQNFHSFIFGISKKYIHIWKL
jgi:hypothetical protein